MTATNIPIAGVIGDPIAHSRSPQLHGHWLKRYGLAGHYIPLHVTTTTLKNTLEVLPKIGFVGLNVTIPHKEAVIDLADIVTDRAALMGAANTLIFRKDGKIHADNTDGYGFLENLKSNAPGWKPSNGPAAVFGAGGASRAVLASLLEAGVPKIFLTNRTKQRAEYLQKEFGSKIEVIDWVKAGNVLEDSATVVNTTSLGMTGHSELRVPLDGLRPDAVVTDLVYSPIDTKLLRDAQDVGCTTVDGLGMLLHQAAPAFERWFGKRPDVDQELRDAVLA